MSTSSSRPLDPPPLRRRAAVSQVVLCWLVGLLLAGVTLGVQLELLDDRQSDAQNAALLGLLLLDLVLGTAAVLLLPRLRRRLPVWAVLAVVAATAVSSVAVPASLLTVVWVAARRSLGLLTATVVALVLAGVASDRVTSRALGAPPTAAWQVALVMVGVAVVPTLIGLAQGRREAAAQARDREAAALRREHDALLRQHEAEGRENEARLAQAREAERTRIARDMHDSLAHHLSLIAVHAGALEYRADLGPEATRGAAATVAEAARSANADLRQVLGVLRAGEGGAEPIPDLGRVRELVSADVRWRDGSLDPVALATVPETTSRHAYRMLQEAVTNARKHAPGQPVTVLITGGPADGLTLEVVNPVGPTGSAGLGLEGSGLGLAGVAERARLAGGWARTGIEDDAFAVRAWLPW